MERSPSARRWEHPPEHSFWMSLSAVEREAFEDAGDEIVLPAGAVVCAEELDSAHVTLIKSGWSKVVMSEGHDEWIVALRGPGDIVGERAAMTRRSRSAVVIALDDVRGIALSASRFHDLISEHPRLQSVLAKQEQERLAEDNEPLLRTGADEIEYRLAYLLSELAFRRGERTPAGTTLSLPLSRKDLARWADAERDDIGQVLKIWRRHGLIVTARHSLTIVDAQNLNDLYSRRAKDVEWSSLNCSIFFIDVVGFSSAVRDESDRAEVRTALYDILVQAFKESGLSWSSCYHEDRGDGVLVIVPPAIPTRSVADPLLAWLRVGLRRHNRRASAAMCIRLRAALHVGPVVRDREGLSGDAIINTARMLDSGPLRAALEESKADLAFMVSDHVFVSSIRTTVGMLDADAFTPVDFQLKSSHIKAWLYVPPDSGRETRPQAPRQDAQPPQQGSTHFHGAVSIQGDVITGTKHVG
ncbi:cyclic nucleotide-binding domain-containing protein [Actinomadura barringtoniae]|uniref:Cyclic nucleotide-binding domain-containing protein n=1 Tax=Actinomadura barringtoniae TaxID=1427535 RepID=A0A939PDI6_9ACTN|nr:cyclic nucleotide-binding domain-containing protein [Actinomadura barringtoniae]MBO2450852.1 cyclic nucleotide-binding domain-containing protein [Actinomadura barringtoniae]